MHKTKTNFFRRGLGAAMAVLASVSCLAVSAFAAETGTALGEPPLEQKTGLEIGMDIQVAGRTGNWYDSGDLLVLTASVENHTEYPVSGDLWLTYPYSGCVVVSEPVLKPRDGHDSGVYAVDDLQPGMGAEAVLVLRAPDACDVTDWVATATFAIENGGGCAAETAEAHFGQPLVKLDKKSLVRDGVLDIKNEGTGGASCLKFRFLAKSGWQTQKGLPDGAKYIGEGRIEIDLGGLSVKGHINRDYSGLLHERMDPDGPFELVYEDWEERQADIID